MIDLDRLDELVMAERWASFHAALSLDVWLALSAELRDLRRFKEDTLIVQKLLLEEKVNRGKGAEDE